MPTLRALALVTAGFAYAVIVIGFIVRITGSGMGCGPDWPLCNGRVIPAFTGPDVVIEWLHRIAVLGLAALTVAVVISAAARRRQPGGSGPGGTLRPASLALGLLVVQSLIGRLAVKLELETLTVVLHLVVALALLGTLVVLALRAGSRAGAPTQSGRAAPRTHRLAITPLALGGAAIVLGGLTAHLGASWACQGFPLCSGTFWPVGAGSGLSRIHWVHRLLGYGLLVVVFAFALGLARQPGRLRTSAWATAALVVAQLLVAAVMVLAALPAWWRGLHAALGTALWVALVYSGWLAVRGR